MNFYDHKLENMEKVLTKLRASGASQADCVQVICRNLNLSLNEADEIVLNAEAWKDMKNQTTFLREKIWEAFENFDETILEE